jgi:putative tricarboxylic transport membrane protein
MQAIAGITKSKKKFLTAKEFKSIIPANLLTLVISNIVGIIPGTGGDIASIISWGQCKRMSKHPEEYGKGSIEGFTVSCASNNAVIGGSMTTMLALGIPGDAVTAVFIGSLMMYGMTPGPRMFVENRSFVLTLTAQLIVANLVILVVGLTTSRIYPKILRVKKQTLWVAVIVCCFVGGFAINNSPVDLIAMSIAGLLGFVLRKMDFPLGPMVLGLLLGRMLEANLRRALTISAGSYSIFLASPIAVFLITCTALSLIAPPIVQYIKDRRKKQTIGTSSTTEES